MTDNNTILILVILNIFSLIIGIILGKIWSNSGVSNIEKPKSFFQQHSENKTKVSIDDTKYVTNIKTDGLEKKYTNLGEIKQSQENIQSSVNKLKNMKG
jgi:hypothetical protein